MMLVDMQLAEIEQSGGKAALQEVLRNAVFNDPGN
jgi:hypothetical protein